MLTASTHVPGMTAQFLVHIPSNQEPCPPSFNPNFHATAFDVTLYSHQETQSCQILPHTSPCPRVEEPYKQHAQTSFSSQMGGIGGTQREHIWWDLQGQNSSCKMEGRDEQHKTAPKDTPCGSGPDSLQLPPASQGGVRMRAGALLPCTVLNTCIGLNLQPGWEGPPHVPTSLLVLAVSASWDAFPCPHHLLLFPSQTRLHLLGILRTLLVCHTGPRIQF